METQNKANHGVMNGAMADQRGARTTCDLVLRVLALLLTLAAAIVFGVNKQTKIVPIKIVDTLPPINITVLAKWKYLSAFVYFEVSNAIACSYAALSLLLLSKGGSKGLAPIIVILDLLITALLFSSIGAATAIGVMGYEGNSHVRWEKVCNVLGKFCHQVAAATVLSLLGSVVFLFLLVHAVLRLQRQSN